MSEHYALEIAGLVEKNRVEWIELCDRIWDLAELKFEEYESAQLLIDVFERNGFQVQRQAGGLATAFVASYGSAGPVIGFLGEYDALPTLSQKASIAKQEPLIRGGNGHGCGHNLLGVGSAAAALAAKEYLEKHQLKGVLRYFGCPAEEGGGGKVMLAAAHVFDDVDSMLTWHPSYAHYVQSSATLASQTTQFRFIGQSAHAAKCPHAGRSALDAVELMNVGANYLREHIPSEARVHYAITNTGGFAPNVVQAEAEVHYQIRSPLGEQVEAIHKRVCDIAKGAALMTGTRVEIKHQSRYLNVIPNTTLEAVVQKHLESLGIPPVDEIEQGFAREIRATLSKEEKEEHCIPETVGLDLAQKIPPYRPHMPTHFASTDVGDVSWIVPTAQYRSAVWAVGTQAHTWQAVAQGKSSFAHKGTLFAGKLLAATAINLIMEPELIALAKQELAKILKE